MLLSSAPHKTIILSCLLLLLSAFISGLSFRDSKWQHCCKKLKLDKPGIRLKECFILPDKDRCLESVMFIDVMNKSHCINTTAPWLSSRIERFEKQNHKKCKDYTKS